MINSVKYPSNPTHLVNSVLAVNIFPNVINASSNNLHYSNADNSIKIEFTISECSARYNLHYLYKLPFINKVEKWKEKSCSLHMLKICSDLWHRFGKLCIILEPCLQTPRSALSAGSTELSQIERRRILGRRAINLDCPPHKCLQFRKLKNERYIVR